MDIYIFIFEMGFQPGIGLHFFKEFQDGIDVLPVDIDSKIDGDNTGGFDDICKYPVERAAAVPVRASIDSDLGTCYFQGFQLFSRIESQQCAVRNDMGFILNILLFAEFNQSIAQFFDNIETEKGFSTVLHCGKVLQTCCNSFFDKLYDLLNDGPVHPVGFGRFETVGTRKIAINSRGNGKSQAFTGTVLLEMPADLEHSVFIIKIVANKAPFF